MEGREGLNREVRGRKGLWEEQGEGFARGSGRGRLGRRRRGRLWHKKEEWEAEDQGEEDRRRGGKGLKFR